ncbi:MAG: Abi family protein [Clostridia bacterium]|nr:Abi family protein [Clostridia bacterium]
MKQPKTYDEQVSILEMKGFIIEDRQECIKFLREANYYRFSAYLLPYKLPDGTYKPNIPLKRIQNIYEFDGKLSNWIFHCIEKIEFYIRSQIAYYYGHKYGSLGYL